MLSNALDASPAAAEIVIDFTESADEISLFISDNGCGWPMALADSLMKPFTTSKEIGLGSACLSAAPLCSSWAAACGSHPR